jgi:hypothetical protein
LGLAHHKIANVEGVVAFVEFAQSIWILAALIVRQITSSSFP